MNTLLKVLGGIVLVVLSFFFAFGAVYVMASVASRGWHRASMVPCPTCGQQAPASITLNCPGTPGAPCIDNSQCDEVRHRAKPIKRTVRPAPARPAPTPRAPAVVRPIVAGDHILIDASGGPARRIAEGLTGEQLAQPCPPPPPTTPVTPRPTLSTPANPSPPPTAPASDFQFQPPPPRIVRCQRGQPCYGGR